MSLYPPTTLPRLAAVCLVVAASPAAAAQSTLFDRGGAWVSVEAFGPNIIHVVLSSDETEAQRDPGYGILKKTVDDSGLVHSVRPDGDDFSAAGVRLHVDPTPPSRNISGIERYFLQPLPPVGLSVRDGRDRVLLEMTG